MKNDRVDFDPHHQIVGRHLRTAFDTEEIIYLTKGWWEYYDWCIDIGLDMAGWVKKVDERNTPEDSLSDILWYALWEHHCSRIYQKQSCPPIPEPEAYADYADAKDKHINSKIDDEWSGRHLNNALGVKEYVTMQEKHWKLFDHMEGLGGDMKKWVVEADVQRHSSSKKPDLSGEMIASLCRFERKAYFEKGNLPLFISPRGYDASLNHMKGRRSSQVTERELMDSHGAKVAVALHEKYWKHFDWLEEQGIDMVAWVKEADVSRFKDDLELTLRSEIMVNLQDDERIRYLNGEPCPLFIKPSGYGER